MCAFLPLLITYSLFTLTNTSAEDTMSSAHDKTNPGVNDLGKQSKQGKGNWKGVCRSLCGLL